MKIIILLLFILSLHVSAGVQRWVIYGQSNAFASTQGDWPANMDVTINTKVKIWERFFGGDNTTFTNVDGGQMLTPNGGFNVWNVSLSPPQQRAGATSNLTATNNYLYELARKISEYTGDDVECVVVGWGASRISKFHADGNTYNVNDNPVAWQDLSGIMNEVGWEEGSVTGIIWAQGEQNQGYPFASYQQEFLEMRADLSTLPGITDSTPMFITELKEGGSDWLNGWFDTLEQLSTPQNYPFIVIPTRDLAANDPVHYSTDSVTKIGRERLFKAYLSYYVVVKSNSLPISVSALQVKDLSGVVQNYDVTITFEGASLYYSDDLNVWTKITGATSPYLQTVPRHQKHRYYKSQ